MSQCDRGAPDGVQDCVRYVSAGEALFWRFAQGFRLPEIHPAAERATAPRKYCASCPFGLGCRDRRSFRRFCEIGTRALPMLVSQLPVEPPREDWASGAQRCGQSQAGLST